MGGSWPLCGIRRKPGYQIGATRGAQGHRTLCMCREVAKFVLSEVGPPECVAQLDEG